MQRVAVWAVRHPVSRWGDAVLMLGLLRWAEALGQTVLVRYMQDWADHHRDSLVTESKRTLGPALYAVDLYRATRQYRYRDRAGWYADSSGSGRPGAPTGVGCIPTP